MDLPQDATNDGFPFDATMEALDQANGTDIPHMQLSSEKEPAPLNGIVEKVLEEAEMTLSTPPKEVQVFTFTRPQIRKGRVNGSHTEIFTGTQEEYHEQLRKNILRKVKRY